MKQSSTTCLLAFLLPFFFACSVFAQTSAPAISRFDRRMTPPSPEATQLGVFGSTSPDLNTGAVQTTIPLLEVKNRQLSLAVALNYHYTGLQVSETSSWVGMGWTLGAGGVITRTVQGLPDELENSQGYSAGGWSMVSRLQRSPGGGLFPGGLVSVELGSSGTAFQKLLLCKNISAGLYDSEPDAYTVSTPFYSGKLFLDSTGVITCSPHSDVKFTGSASGGWTATTGDGTVYRYTATQTTGPAFPDSPGAPIAAPTAWYLTEVESVDGDLINLSYGGNTNVFSPMSSAVRMTRDAYSQYPTRDYSPCSRYLPLRVVLPPVWGTTWTGQNTRVTSLWLASITTYTRQFDATTEVAFISDQQRADLNDQVGQRLTRIVNRDLTTQQIKKQYDFTYGYFNAGGQAKEKRLKLRRVQELGKPPYVFTYDTTTATSAPNGSRDMPSRDNLARDHWGYYNGCTANATLMPSLPPSMAGYKSTSGTGLGKNANRLPNWTFAKLGALTRVQYPTGGRTEYTYESNSVEVADDYADITANQFGGVLVGTPMESYGAGAKGGAAFTNDMTPWERNYARTHNYIDTNIDGAGSGALQVPQNINAQRIVAPHGFTLADIRCFGTVTPNQQMSGSCPTLPAEQQVRVFMYKLKADSTLDQLCNVGFDIQRAGTGIAARCTTKISTGGAMGSDALKAQSNFTAGTYYLVAEVNSADIAFNANIAVDLNMNPAPRSTTSSPGYRTLFVGGIRLAKTLDLTGTGDTLTKTFRYRQLPADGTDRSSGVLFFQPEYAYTRPCGELVVSEQNIGKLNWLDAGYHVGYSRVEVESRGRRAGTTVYYYSNTNVYGPNCRNVVTKVEELNQTGVLVKRTLNTYEYPVIAASPGFRLTSEYSIELFGEQSGVGTTGGTGILNSVYFWFAPRSYFSYWPQLKRTTEQVFGSNASMAEDKRDTTTYSYLAFGPGKTSQPVQVVQYLGRHKQLITRTKYYGQYALGTISPTSAPAVGLAGLKQHNMVSVPVEHQRWLRTGADTIVIGGDLTQFANLRPARIFALATTVPIPVGSFVSSKVQSGTFQQDARYIERVAFPLYSPLGSLLQQRVAQSPPNSYLWGHAESKLIAEAQNASYAQIAFTSFEPDASGRWQYDDSTTTGSAHLSSSNHFTGARSYKLDDTPEAAIRRTGLPAGEYEVLVWGNGTNVPSLTGDLKQQYDLVATSGNWRQHRYRLSLAANATLQLKAESTQFLWIDELRLSPVGARMTSYTHDPLVGLTSQTDPSGRSTTFEYDAVGRLVRTRDEQGHILSQQQYHYARP